MDHRIETVRKNYEERMTEFVSVLNREDCLPGSKIMDEWRFHLELTLKKYGWVAVYKPLRNNKQLPSTLDYANELVMVEKVEFHNFEAYVIGADQCETQTTSSETSSTVTNKMFCVPLEDLYPCIKQPDSDVDGIEISNIIDQFRFFRVNLWLPWDEEDDNEDWRMSALEPRMQLLYDMDQGLVSCEVFERVKRLWRQAWDIHDTLQSLEVAIDDDGSPVPLEVQAHEEEGLVIKIMQLHHRLDCIKHELERLQNPLIRNLMVREKQRMMQRSDRVEAPWSRLVWGGGSSQDLASLVSDASLVAGSDQRLKMYPLLPLALEEASTGDFIFLAPGKYSVTGSGGLECGGTINGLGMQKAIVSGCEAGDVMFSISCKIVIADETEMGNGGDDCSSAKGFSFTIANVTLEAYKMEICLLLNAGFVLLDNCVIDGGGSHDKDDSVGAIVRAGAKLLARNCTFTGFTSAIIAYENSQVELVNCQIKNCDIGVQIYKGAELSMKQCTLSECSSQGIYYKWCSHVPADKDKLLAEEVLNTLPGVSVSESNFQGVPLAMQVSRNEDDTSIMNLDNCM
ncbi:protein nessun dorma [Neocloeon triangulifer]|uniref:protein nessun dorma n=1 Tax=Neocloeon triangulifer TaxID=2078957 RepID=UPI00286F2ADA|nr:protein nessun dorma [Neocloeon triangulifer]XP_059482318.1 protein nessun dorma [Neocloeon triangulifer]XP_059482319.1 protein nessun dorma [Neocloeon triangulifer]